MKRQLLTLIAAAGMLLLGGVSAKADEGTTLTLKVSEGTFDNQGGSYHKTWTRNSSPVITITAGNNENDMCTDSSGNSEYSEGFELHEGSSYAQEDYIVSVEYGYLITGMSFKVVTAASGDQIPTVTLGDQTVTASSSPADMSVSGLNASSVSITLSSTSTNGYATLYNWTVTVVKDPDAKDFSVDLSQMKITAISEAITEQPTEGKWYLLKQDRSGTSPAYDAGEGSTMMRAADDNVVQVGDAAEDVAQYLLRFISTDKTSTALTKSVVVNPQWGTGNFWTSTLTTTSDFGSAGSYNMYLTSSTSGTSTFAFNLYDMQNIVDNNGVSNALAFWETGEVTATSGNNVWWLYEVTLEKDESYFDLTHQKIATIGDSITALPTSASQWYLIKNDRQGDTGNYGYMTPAYDNGEGNTIMRAAEDHLKAGDPVEEVAQYLVRFLPTGETSSQLTKSTVVHLQWATGNYWTNSLTTSSHEAEAASYNMYLTADGGSTFAFNLYDMGSIVDNNGVGSNLVLYGTGEVKATSNANNIWWLYPVTFEEMTDTDDAAEAELIELREAIEEVQAAYDAYTVSGYNTNVETGFTSGNGIGNGLIKETSQFWSPYTESPDVESGCSLDNLLDNDASTYWHSTWYGGSVDNGVHYIEVDLTDDFVGGPLLVNILRRSGAMNDHVTKMRVTSASAVSTETADTTWIADLDLPYGGMGERVVAGFTCPYGVKTLRFYEEETTGSSAYNEGFFHLADFQLFYTTIDPDITDLISDELSALAAAIATAQAKADDIIGITQADIDSLKEALETCQTAVEARTDSAPCTLTEAKWGTLILPFDYDAPGGIMAYTSDGVNEDNELNLTLVDDGKLTANTPYIIGGVASSYTLTSIMIDAGSSGLTDGTLTGTFELMYAPEGSYVLQQHDGDEVPAFYKVAEDNTISVGAYHCYLNAQSGNAKAVVYFPGTARDDDDNVATAIEAVETAAQTGSEAVYDLSGRKVTNPRSGIYIKGGKKVIIK